MKKDMLFVVYHPIEKEQLAGKVLVKGFNQRHPLSFDLLWCNLLVDEVYKDDLDLTKVDKCSTIDDLLFNLDEQYN